MNSLFCGVTCALDADGSLTLDPTAKQEKVRSVGRSATRLDSVFPLVIRRSVECLCIFGGGEGYFLYESVSCVCKWAFFFFSGRRLSSERLGQCVNI